MKAHQLLLLPEPDYLAKELTQRAIFANITGHPAYRADDCYIYLRMKLARFAKAQSSYYHFMAWRHASPVTSPTTA